MENAHRSASVNRWRNRSDMRAIHTGGFSMSNTSHPQHLPPLTKDGEDLRAIKSAIKHIPWPGQPDIMLGNVGIGEGQLHLIAEWILADRASHQTAQTEQLVEALKAKSGQAFEYTHNLEVVPLDTAIALVKGGEQE